MIAGRQVDEDVKGRINGISTLIDFANFNSAVVLEAFNVAFGLSVDRALDRKPDLVVVVVESCLLPPARSRQVSF